MALLNEPSALCPTCKNWLRTVPQLFVSLPIVGNRATCFSPDYPNTNGVPQVTISVKPAWAASIRIFRAGIPAMMFNALAALTRNVRVKATCGSNPLAKLAYICRPISTFWPRLNPIAACTPLSSKMRSLDRLSGAIMNATVCAVNAVLNLLYSFHETIFCGPCLGTDCRVRHGPDYL